MFRLLGIENTFFFSIFRDTIDFFVYKRRHGSDWESNRRSLRYNGPHSIEFFNRCTNIIRISFTYNNHKEVFKQKLELKKNLKFCILNTYLPELNLKIYEEQIWVASTVSIKTHPLQESHADVSNGEACTDRTTTLMCKSAPRLGASASHTERAERVSAIRGVVFLVVDKKSRSQRGASGRGLGGRERKGVRKRSQRAPGTPAGQPWRDLVPALQVYVLILLTHL